MEYHFKKEEYNWGDRFYIYDAFGNKIYYIKSSILLWNRKFEICDLNKNTLMEIKNEPKSPIKKKFYICLGKEKFASITKEISIIPKYTFEGIDCEMIGVMQHDYKLVSKGNELLSITFESTSWGHHPVVTIHKSSNELLMLALALTLSYVMNAREDTSSTTHL